MRQHNTQMTNTPIKPGAPFSLGGRPYVALHNLLKFEGWCESGAAAKHLIDSGAVTVDGDVELRRRCKIVSGQVVALEKQSVEVVVTANCLYDPEGRRVRD